MENLFRTGLLIAALTALFMAVGYWVAGPQGMIVALIIAAVMNLFTYWSADSIVLSIYGAQEVDETQAPGPLRIVRDLAGRAGLPMPRVYLIDSEQPNAFATGRNPQHAAVAVTSGLLRTLPDHEEDQRLAELLSVSRKSRLSADLRLRSARQAPSVTVGGAGWSPPSTPLAQTDRLAADAFGSG